MLTRTMTRPPEAATCPMPSRRHGPDLARRFFSATGDLSLRRPFRAPVSAARASRPGGKKLGSSFPVVVHAAPPGNPGRGTMT